MEKAADFLDDIRVFVNYLKKKVVLSPEYTLDQKATENILEERAVPFAKHAQNATITKKWKRTSD